MALESIQQNIISDLMAEAEAMLKARDRFRYLIARFNQNDTYNQVSDTEELQAITTFAHLNQSKIGNGITALTAIVTALGDDSSGQAANLIMMKG